MGKHFGTDGFRGEANVDLTVEHAYKVGRFLGWYYGKQAKGDRCRVVIGKDTRRSSYMFEYSLAAGLFTAGQTGAAAEGLTWGRALIGNLLPVTLGNLVGGGLLVGVSAWYLYLKKEINSVNS